MIKYNKTSIKMTANDILLVFLSRLAGYVKRKNAA